MIATSSQPSYYDGYYGDGYYGYANQASTEITSGKEPIFEQSMVPIDNIAQMTLRWFHIPGQTTSNDMRGSEIALHDLD